MTIRSRRALLVLLALLLPTAASLPVWLARHDLPARVATHWSVAAQPDAWMSLSAFVRTIGQLSAVGVVLLLAAAVCATPTSSARPPLLATGAFVGGLFGGLAAGIATWTVLVQRGLDDTHTLPAPRGLALTAIVAAPVFVGVLAAGLAHGRPEPATHDGSPLASLQLGDGEQATWWQRLSASWPWVLALVGLAHMVVGIFLESAILAMTLSVSGLVLVALGVAMSSIRVSADKRGVIVRWGPLGWPSTTVPLGDIARASAIDVRPLDCGGWGYRGSLRLLGWAAIVMRAGPGLRMDLRSGKVMTVTVDDPETAAGLLNQLIVRSGTGESPSNALE